MKRMLRGETPEAANKPLRIGNQIPCEHEAVSLRCGRNRRFDYRHPRLVQVLALVSPSSRCSDLSLGGSRQLASRRTAAQAATRFTSPHAVLVP